MLRVLILKQELFDASLLVFELVFKAAGVKNFSKFRALVALLLG